MAEHHTQDAELLDKLENLARDTQGWGNVRHVWRDEGDEAYIVGHINKDGEKYPVLAVDTEQYYENGPALANFYAAANPAAVLQLVAMARRSIPQGEPAKADAQGDDLPPEPMHIYHWNGLALVTIEAMREYGASCRAAGIAEGRAYQHKVEAKIIERASCRASGAKGGGCARCCAGRGGESCGGNEGRNLR